MFEGPGRLHLEEPEGVFPLVVRDVTVLHVQVTK